MEINPNLSEKAKYDYKLIQSALNGDQQAYAQLMSRYRDSIYYMLLKMVNNKNDAEDLTIEAFGKAFKNLHQYTPNYAFSTWLFKIASNNCIDFIRKKKKDYISINEPNGQHKDEEGSYQFPSTSPDPEEKLIRFQKMNYMKQMVSQLKPRYRELVELRYYKEYSYEEISQTLDLPLGTVKAQLFRARELLFNLINNQNDHQPDS